MLRNERCSQIGQLYVTEILSPLTQMDRLRTMILWFGRQHRTGVPLNHITKAVFLGRARLEISPLPYGGFKLCGPPFRIGLATECCRLGLVALQSNLCAIALQTICGDPLLNRRHFLPLKPTIWG